MTLQASRDLLPFRLEAAVDRIYVPAPEARVAIPEVDALAVALFFFFSHLLMISLRRQVRSARDLPKSLHQGVLQTLP